MSRIVEDADGDWECCARRDCDLELVRPGKVQCSGETDRIGCPRTEPELIDRLTKHCAELRQHAEALAGGLHNWNLFADEYLPSLMARPGSTALKHWSNYHT